MILQDQLKKVESDLKKIEEKRKELLAKRKKIIADIEIENARIKAEKNQKIIDLVSENFGEITEENIDQFRKIISSGQNENSDSDVTGESDYYGAP